MRACEPGLDTAVEVEMEVGVERRQNRPVRNPVRISRAWSGVQAVSSSATIPVPFAVAGAGANAPRMKSA